VSTDYFKPDDSARIYKRASVIGKAADTEQPIERGLRISRDNPESLYMQITAPEGTGTFGSLPGKRGLIAQIALKPEEAAEIAVELLKAARQIEGGEDEVFAALSDYFSMSDIDELTARLP
jgi:hypothetical protein